MIGNRVSTRRFSIRPPVPCTLLFLGLVTPLLSPAVAAAQDKPSAAGAVQTAERVVVKLRGGVLSPREIQEGWILLFDGETMFGWKSEGSCRVADGTIHVQGPATLTNTTAFGDFELVIEAALARGVKANAQVVLNGHATPLPASAIGAASRWRVESKGGQHTVKRGDSGEASETHPGASHTPLAIRVPEGMELGIRSVKLKPIQLEPIFNGKDLTGWKPLPDRKSVFSVTDKGELNVKDGNGDLQSEGQYQDFVLQLEVISHGKHLNSGIFFRALPGEFWQGYEAQIRNQWEGDDRTRPVDYGTGGVYNRQKSRKVVSSDHEWFTYTIVADGLHVALWVNGYQTADYVDEQKPAPSARKGSYAGKGCITIQGHDPTTNLSFRNIRIAELPDRPKRD